MSKMNQSLIKVYLNNNDEIVIAYGDSEGCGFQELEISCLVINRKDLMPMSEALSSLDDQYKTDDK